jgi:hypothetical protein
MTFTASNCSKRDPIVLEKNNPRNFGNPVGFVRVFVRPLTPAAPDVANASVNIALSIDSLKADQFHLPTRQTNDSGRVNYDNLVLNKIYYFKASYKDPATTVLLKSGEEPAKANPFQLPTNLVLVVQ